MVFKSNANRCRVKSSKKASELRKDEEKRALKMKIPKTALAKRQLVRSRRVNLNLES